MGGGLGGRVGWSGARRRPAGRVRQAALEAGTGRDGTELAMPFFRDPTKPQPVEFHAEILLGAPPRGLRLGVSLQRRHTMKE